MLADIASLCINFIHLKGDNLGITYLLIPFVGSNNIFFFDFKSVLNILVTISFTEPVHALHIFLWLLLISSLLHNSNVYIFVPGLTAVIFSIL